MRLADSDLQPSIVRATALELLARIPHADATTTLDKALQADESLLRRTATDQLPLNEPADVERLTPLLSDPVKAVRMAAVARLAPVPRDLLKPYQQEAFDSALTEYRAAMAYTLDFPGSNYNLGNLEYALGDVAAAEKWFRAALAIDDLFYPAKANLAVLLSGQGRNGDAASLLREILRDYPDNVDAMYSLGLLLVEMGQSEEGADWLTRAAARLPDDARAHYNLGLLQQQLGRINEAEGELRRALAIEPTRLDYLHALADFLYRHGRFDEAGTLADRMIQLYPNEPIGHQLKAAIDTQSP